jgi:hypothetical protein
MSGGQNGMYRLHVLLFIALLISGGVGLFFSENEAFIRDTEKRRMNPVPTPSWGSLLDGNYARQVEAWAVDRLPGRKEWMEAAVWLTNSRGFAYSDERVYQGINPAAAHHQAATDSAVQKPEKNKASQLFRDSLRSDTAGYVNEQLFITRGRALQLFGGNTAVARRFARVVNRYAQVLGPQVNVYCGVAPSASELYLPEKYRSMGSSEAANIQFIGQQLDSTVRFFDPVPFLHDHLHQYLYFHTDHHWTARGAYQAYAAWCTAASMEPVPLDQMTRKVIPNFYGSLYLQTRDNILKKNRDSVEFFRPAQATTTHYYTAMDQPPNVGDYLVEYARGHNSYGVFLGADYPMMCIKVANPESERRVLLIKNSYGNAFAPFLVNHFKEVHVADYRYFTGSIREWVAKHQITDVIILHGVFSANTDWHVARTAAILTNIK